MYCWTSLEGHSACCRCSSYPTTMVRDWLGEGLGWGRTGRVRVRDWVGGEGCLGLSVVVK